jgi:hypothetical protein
VTRYLSGFTGRRAAAVVALSALLLGASCGKSMMRQGDGSSYLIVTLLQAAPGGAPGTTPSTFSDYLQSTVSSGTDDIGQVTVRMALKDTVSTGVTPTAANTITITDYSVVYVPSAPGLTGFSGALTGTVSASDTTLSFVLVRHQDKAGLTTPSSTAAHVTFNGHDQAGHAVSVTASINVTFVS